MNSTAQETADPVDADPPELSLASATATPPVIKVSPGTRWACREMMVKEPYEGITAKPKSCSVDQSNYYKTCSSATPGGECTGCFPTGTEPVPETTVTKSLNEDVVTGKRWYVTETTGPGCGGLLPLPTEPKDVGIFSTNRSGNGLRVDVPLWCGESIISENWDYRVEDGILVSQRKNTSPQLNPFQVNAKNIACEDLVARCQAGDTTFFFQGQLNTLDCSAVVPTPTPTPVPCTAPAEGLALTAETCTVIPPPPPPFSIEEAYREDCPGLIPLTDLEAARVHLALRVAEGQLKNFSCRMNKATISAQESEILRRYFGTASTTLEYRRGLRANANTVLTRTIPKFRAGKVAMTLCDFKIRSGAAFPLLVNPTGLEPRAVLLNRNLLYDSTGKSVPKGNILADTLLHEFMHSVVGPQKALNEVEKYCHWADAHTPKQRGGRVRFLENTCGQQSPTASGPLSRNADSFAGAARELAELGGCP